MRHPFLASLALLGLAALPARGDWLSDANARIEAERKAAISVKVVDAKGNVIKNAAVALRETESAFRWGTAVNSEYFAAAGTPGADRLKYKAKIDELFNQVVIENGLKWTNWETPAVKARTNATIDALLAQDKTLRGHAMIWQRDANLPADVQAMRDANDVSGLAARTASHIANIGAAMQGKASEWDVLNEQWAHHELTDVMNPGVANSALAPAQVAWFKQARAADPSAKLFVNDYSILASSGLTNTTHQQYLYDQVAYLKSQGAPVDGIGFQSHFGSASAATSGDKIVQILDRYASLGVALEVTEFDMYGTGWTEASKAAYMRDFMTAVFAESAVVGFNTWGFWDGQHFDGTAPLFNLDWSLKASGQVFMDLVFDQWRTNVSGTTGATGTYATRGFLGDYAVDVTLDGKTKTYATTLDANGRSLTIVVPEPASLAMLAGVVLMAKRRRR